MVRLVVNGAEREGPGERSLLAFLREDCGLTAVKDGCGSGDCGACTVLVDGRPRLSCTRTVGRVAGSRIETPEGIGGWERERIAAALVAAGAVQCGFCTPGIAMRLVSLLRQETPLAPEERMRALRPHLCRCTGYGSILAAAEALLGGGREEARREEPPVEEDGRSLPRYEGRERAFGAIPYVADRTAPGLLHGALCLARVARGVLRAVHLEKARSLPGVRAVIGAQDVPGERYVGLLRADWPVFVAVGEEIRTVGDVICTVAADTAEIARAAAELVEVEIEPLPPLTSPEAALSEGAPPLHPGGNLLSRTALLRGDAEEAISRAACVLRETFVTPMQEQAFLEPEAALAEPGGDGGMVVYSPSQGAYEDRRQIAAVLGLSPERVRVRLVPSGGAFGGKEDLSVQAHAALLAQVCRRPVRIVLSRSESILRHPKRHPFVMKYEVAVDGEGHLLLVRARILGDTGAYASVGEKVLERAATHAAGPYRTGAVDVEALAVYTNNPPAGAFRGFGVPQVAFAMEGMMDRLARALGLTPAEIRERNMVRPGDTLPQGQRVGEEVRGLWEAFRIARQAAEAHPRAGLALAFKNVGLGMGAPDAGRVRLQVTGEGKVEILGGASEMGQGISTVLQQVVWEETGLPAERMTVILGDTDRCPDGGMTTASRQTFFGGRAARSAARRLAQDLRACGGDLIQLAGRTYEGEFAAETARLGEEGPQHVAYGFGAQVVFLDERGRLERVLAVHDVGRAVNPLLLRGQIQGAVVQGLGFALWEDLGLRDGIPQSDRLGRLGLPRIDQVPPIEVVLVEPDPSAEGPKGVGEIALVPTAPALAAACARLSGRWPRSLPLQLPEVRP